MFITGRLRTRQFPASRSRPLTLLHQTLINVSFKVRSLWRCSLNSRSEASFGRRRKITDPQGKCSFSFCFQVVELQHLSLWYRGTVMARRSGSVRHRTPPSEVGRTRDRSHSRYLTDQGSRDGPPCQCRRQSHSFKESLRRVRAIV
jgi:hypothetical protein